VSNSMPRIFFAFPEICIPPTRQEISNPSVPRYLSSETWPDLLLFALQTHANKNPLKKRVATHLSI